MSLFPVSPTLIERKFTIRLGVSAVGALLAKLGLTPQRPLQRAYQRDPDAIEAWRRERFPAIARQAKASGGEVYFWDEWGFRADAVHGKTWGKKGQTPMVERPDQRQSISAASAVNARGAFWYCTYHGDPRGRSTVGAKLRSRPDPESVKSLRAWLSATRNSERGQGGRLRIHCRRALRGGERISGA